jgi:hypothetical protein
MAKKIFVSYKYSDSKVYPIFGKNPTTARHYVDELSTLLTSEDHIYKGENDGESLGTLVDATIGSKLGDKIFDSTVTIVLISKGMREIYTAEKEQWIPWEISYSLKEQSREGKNSKTNAMLAVVLPDETGSYEYYLTYNAACNSTTHKTSTLFQILRENMFNIKDKEANTKECNGSKIFVAGDPSYIHTVTWEEFKKNINAHIDRANKIRQNIHLYELTKNVK